ncbi:hypothetical protein GCM10009569_09150 [Arthrobacter russicus]
MPKVMPRAPIATEASATSRRETARMSNTASFRDRLFPESTAGLPERDKSAVIQIAPELLCSPDPPSRCARRSAQAPGCR